MSPGRGIEPPMVAGQAAPLEQLGEDVRGLLAGQVNAAKTWIKLKVSNFSMFRNPGKDELVVVNFDQDYRSNNLSNVMKKRQYWTKEGGKWRIIYEGAG